MLLNNIKNEFDNEANEYKEYRLEYPKEIFEWIKSIKPVANNVLDLGTGNGQAAIKLADFYSNIYAIDISENQIQCAYKHPNIRYLQMDAKDITFDFNFDLVISATAAHWFDQEGCLDSLIRHLNDDAFVCFWSYSFPDSSDPQTVERLNLIKDLIGNKWSKRSLIHLNKYKDLYFPFEEIENTPQITLELNWTANQLFDFFSTWGFFRDYAKNIDSEFFTKVRKILDDQVYKVEFPLAFRAGFYKR